MARLVRRLLGAAAAAVVMVSSGAFGAAPAWASTPINGGGSGFAALEIQQWQADVASPANGSLQVNYSSQSSGIGRQYFASNTWDYAASDIRYIPGYEDALVAQAEKGRCGGRPAAACFQYVPVSAGGLGFMYNLTNPDGSRIANLKLTPLDVCGIFTGRVTKWNQLAGNNPELASSNASITPVVRQDEAGESFVLSQYCIAVDPSDWNTFVSFQLTNPCAAGQEYFSQDVQAFHTGAPVPTWPSTVEGCRSVPVASGSDGVANYVADPSLGPGSITYNAAAYALVRNFPNAYVENAAGAFTKPDSLSVTIALEFASAVGDGTFRLDFQERSGADPRAYNPSTYSYILAQTGGFDVGRGTTLGKFLCYSIGIGQKDAPSLLYAALSAQVQRIGEAAILKIPGAPPAAACLAGAPPPPPPPKLQLVHPVAPSGSGGSGPNGGAGSGSGTGLTGPGSSRNAGSSNCHPSAHAASTTTTKPHATTTVARTHRAATTTVCSASTGSANGGALGNGAGGALGGASATTVPPALAATMTPHDTTNYDALWSVLEGAAVCALGVVFAGRFRRGSE